MTSLELFKRHDSAPWLAFLLLNPYVFVFTQVGNLSVDAEYYGAPESMTKETVPRPI